MSEGWKKKDSSNTQIKKQWVKAFSPKYLHLKIKSKNKIKVQTTMPFFLSSCLLCSFVCHQSRCFIESSGLRGEPKPTRACPLLSLSQHIENGQTLLSSHRLHIYTPTHKCAQKIRPITWMTFGTYSDHHCLMSYINTLRADEKENLWWFCHWCWVEWKKSRSSLNTIWRKRLLTNENSDRLGRSCFEKCYKWQHFSLISCHFAHHLMFCAFTSVRCWCSL